MAALPFITPEGTFKELSGEELTKFMADAKSEDVAKYYDELNKSRKAALDKAIADKASKEDITKLKDELNESFNASIKVMQGVLKEQGVALQKIIGGMPTGSQKTSLKAEVSKWIKIGRAHV